MTGFGRADSASGEWRVVVSARSVNHRNLDLALRLREPYRHYEPTVRRRVRARLERGRVDLSIELEPLGAPPVEVVVREDMIRSIRSQLESMVRDGVLAASELSAGDVLGWPEVIELRAREHRDDLQLERLLLAVVDQSLDELCASRAEEGRRLQAVLQRDLDRLRAVGQRLETLRESVIAELRDQVEARIRELIGSVDATALDETRLIQEIAYLSERSDVSEEIDRLQVHFDSFERALGREKAVGKRLDFLSQEIARELNTIGAKCRDSDMSAQVVEAKLLCERLREQIQNVE